MIPPRTPYEILCRISARLQYGWNRGTYYFFWEPVGLQEPNQQQMQDALTYAAQTGTEFAHILNPDGTPMGYYHIYRGPGVRGCNEKQTSVKTYRIDDLQNRISSLFLDDRS